MNPIENISCFNLIQNQITELGINAKLKMWVNTFGSYIEIECEDLNSFEQAQILDIRKHYEKAISEKKTIEAVDYPQVDYIVLKFLFTSSYKQKVWTWLQKQFSELSSLPKNFYELEPYHKTSISKTSALYLLNEALNDRIVTY